MLLCRRFGLFLFDSTSQFLILFCVESWLICFQDDLPPNGYYRHGHTCTCTHFGTLICHAGRGHTDTTYLTKDTYVFYPAPKHFSKVEPPVEMMNRMYHAVAYVEQTEQLFMFGGSDEDLASLNDFWMMDTSGKKSRICRDIIKTHEGFHFISSIVKKIL